MGMLSRISKALGWQMAAPQQSASGPAACVPKHAEQLKDNVRKERRGISKLVEEIESDYQFKLGYLTVQALILGVDVSIVGPEGDPRAAALAQNLQSIWDQSLPNAIRSFAYGRAAFEKIFETDPANSLVKLASLDFLPFENTELVLEDAGAFGGIKLTGKGKEPITLEPRCSWWFALDPTPIEPHGRSRYIGAPMLVYDDRTSLKRQAKIWYDRFAIGQAVARFPEPEGAEKDLPEEHPRAKMQAMVSEAESGGTLLLSSARYVNGDGTLSDKYMYDFDPSDGLRDGSALDTRLTRLDAAALRSLGIPERAVTQDSETGTNAMAQAHQQVLFATCDGVLDQIVDSFKKYVIEKLVEFNYPAGARPVIDVQWTPLRETLKATQQTSPTPGFDIGGVLPSFGSPAIPADPSTAVAAAGADNVAATALNGAQIASLVEIIQQVAQGQLPLASAKPILQASFPTLSPEVIDRIVKPVATFEPSGGVQAAAGLAHGIVYRLAAADRRPVPEDAIPPDKLLQQSEEELAALWPRLTEALRNREALPRGVLQQPPA